MLGKLRNFFQSFNDGWQRWFYLRESEKLEMSVRLRPHRPDYSLVTWTLPLALTQVAVGSIPTGGAKFAVAAWARPMSQSRVVSGGTSNRDSNFI